MTTTTTPTLYDLLNKRFCSPQYALFYEVRNTTGYSYGGPQRYADALAMSLWPSRGLDMTGIEVKHERSDWLRELNNPAKAEAIAQFCEYWYVAVPNDDIVKLDEMPKGWGLLVARGSKLVEARKAPKRKVKPWTRPFIASLLRNSYEVSWRHRALTTPNDQVEAKVSAEVEKRVAKREATATADAMRDVQNELNQLRRRNQLFERIAAATGVPLEQEWRWSHLTDGIERIGSMQPHAAVQSMDWTIRQLEKALADAQVVRRTILATTEKPPASET